MQKICYNTTNSTEFNPYLENTMVAYRKDEMVGSTELAKGLGGYLDKITSHSVDKFVIVRHNVPEVIMIPIDEYERMRTIADYAECYEIEQIIKERDPDGNRVGTFDFDSYHAKRMARRQNVSS